METPIARDTVMTGHDMKMREKGYRWKMTATCGSIDPLYGKSLEMVASLMRDWDKIRFKVTQLT